MKKLIFPIIAIAFYACGGDKTEALQAPIDPRDTSHFVLCDTIILPTQDSLGRPMKEWACDSHYVSKELDAKYHQLLEEFEKAKNAK